MREVRKHSPEKKCKLGYDQLEVDNKIFVYRFYLYIMYKSNHECDFSEVEGRVVEERKAKSGDLAVENKELSETVDDLKKIISEQSQALGQQSLKLEEYRSDSEDEY